MNGSGTGFVLQDITKFMDFIVFESALGSWEVISSNFWTP